MPGLRIVEILIPRLCFTSPMFEPIIILILRCLVLGKDVMINTKEKETQAVMDKN